MSSVDGLWAMVSRKMVQYSGTSGLTSPNKVRLREVWAAFEFFFF